MAAVTPPERQQVALVDANAHRSSFVYDLLGVATRRTSTPVAPRVSCGYDAVARIVEQAYA